MNAANAQPGLLNYFNSTPQPLKPSEPLRTFCIDVAESNLKISRLYSTYSIAGCLLGLWILSL